MHCLHHICISVENLKETLEFYQKLGFEKFNEYSDDTVDIVLLKLNSDILEIFHYKTREALPEHAKDYGKDLLFVGVKHFGIGVDDIEDAKKFVKENNLFDGEIEIKRGRLGKPYFFIKDPNGISIEFIENYDFTKKKQ